MVGSLGPVIPGRRTGSAQSAARWASPESITTTVRWRNANARCAVFYPPVVMDSGLVAFVRPRSDSRHTSAGPVYPRGRREPFLSTFWDLRCGLPPACLRLQRRQNPRPLCPGCNNPNSHPPLAFAQRLRHAKRVRGKVRSSGGGGINTENKWVRKTRTWCFNVPSLRVEQFLVVSFRARTLGFFEGRDFFGYI